MDFLPTFLKEHPNQETCSLLSALQCTACMMPMIIMTNCEKIFQLLTNIKLGITRRVINLASGSTIKEVNIPRIGKLPNGAKRGFIERRALLKERLYGKKGFIEIRLYWKKEFIERKALLKKTLYWKNCEIWWKLWNLVKTVKYCQNHEIFVRILEFDKKFQLFFKIVNCGHNCENWPKFINLVKILKFVQN